MLRCAIAFLLVAGRGSNRLDRLVVTTDEVNKPSYSVYEVESRDRFPHPEFIDKLILAKSHIIWHGTYYMPYCSDRLRSSKIASLITKGLTDITHRAHIGFTDSQKAEKSCLKSLPTINNLESGPNVIDVSKCEKKVRRVCTSRIILNLAFQGIVAVDERLGAFAPRNADQPIVVAVNQAIDISSLILNGEMFLRNSTEREQNALAWYQGHLHLFKKDLETNKWSPVTLVGSEGKNGSLITDHVLKVLPDSLLGWEKFYDVKLRRLEYYLATRHRGISRYPGRYWDFGSPSSVAGISVRLWDFYPFCPSRCSDYFKPERSKIWDMTDIMSLGHDLGGDDYLRRHISTYSKKQSHKRLVACRGKGAITTF
ncbi:CSEP0458 putative effector protein [Blumeria hordei DH14]|uniref:CSEP0458 putative effector protein n=1 Tax=Blumeria graminis f. sp. hordei (strain DH14) TaxID=546991 RepID=N1JNW3_BLUG1|nr:CSEP0458 putative effector protein [Blumeria hordei DH14]